MIEVTASALGAHPFPLLRSARGCAASPLAERPYDLRHAYLSTWLNAGVDPTQVYRPLPCMP